MPSARCHHQAAVAVAVVVIVLPFALVASLLVRLFAVTNRLTEGSSSSSPGIDNGQRGRGLSFPSVPNNRTLATTAKTDAPNEQGVFDPINYAYLIVHYHKTGHHLSRSLRDFLVAGTDGPPVSNERENTFQDRMHDEVTGCPYAMKLTPGMIHVQASPDLFCDTNTLAEYLLRNADPLQEKRGVKIVHLVRNPFSLAFSNWVYHTQYPTPESWVKTVDPCAPELYFDYQPLGDLVGPTLLAGNDPIMYREDFDSLRAICLGLYRTRPDSIAREWSFYTHLRHLDPEAALSLATTHMMAQPRSGGDIIRMASNIVKLRQVQRLEDHIRTSQHLLPLDPHERMIQVITLSMEEFTAHPKAATLRFLNSAFGDASVPEVKERIAEEYKRSYKAKLRKGDTHITADKVIMNGDQQNIVELKGPLEEYLRGHELFGRVLGNIERLVNDELSIVSSTNE